MDQGIAKSDQEYQVDLKDLVRQIANQSEQLEALTKRIGTLEFKVDLISNKKKFPTEIFTSKKALATAVGIIAPALKFFGVDIPTEELIAFVGLIGAYVVGQGVADHGKEKEKVRAANPEIAARQTP